MSVSKRLRFEVLRRDNHACRYCGGMAPDVKLTVDHVVPVALGGTDEPGNLVTACRECNAGKSSASADSELVEQVQNDAIRWADAMKAATKVLDRERDERGGILKEWVDDWKDYTYEVKSWRTGRSEAEHLQFPLPIDWDLTVWSLHVAGMTIPELLDCTKIAMARRTVEKFPYFVGIANNKLRDKQEIARRLIDEGNA